MSTTHVYIHLKTGKPYLVMHRGIINATNAQDGQKMVLYTPYTKAHEHVAWYVRSEEEFHRKFRLITDEDQVPFP